MKKATTKEVLNITKPYAGSEITKEMANDGFADPLSHFIARSFNETYGKGYDPAVMDELYKRLSIALETIELLAEEANYTSARWRSEHVIPIQAALTKAKL